MWYAARMTLRAAALALVVVPTVAHADPRELLRAGLDAMGGEARVRALRGLKIEAIGHTLHPEQSERPEGPYIANYDQSVAWRDLAGRRALERREERGAFYAEWTPTTTFVTDAASYRVAADGIAPGDLASYEDGQEALGLAPERVLATAIDAADVVHDGRERAEGLDQDVVRFTWRGRAVRVLLNPHTHLPTLVEVTRAYPENVFLWIWGDVRARTSYGNWQLVGGIALPFSSWRTVNGLPDRDQTITKVVLDPTDAPWPAIDDKTRAAAEERVRKGPPPFAFAAASSGRELADGIRFYPGRWNTTLVRMDDGVVVLEAPIASEYTEGVAAEAARAFPGAPLRAVVSTSDAWPHVGGVRAYAARGVPIYAFELTRPLLARLLDAPHALRPDAWERRRQAEPRAAADIRPVVGRTPIGAGPNRIELYPVRGEGSERMVMAYFPGRKLLYASDLIQPLPDGGFYNPVYLVEIVAAVAREKLAVDTVFAMHAGPTPWADVSAAAARVRRP